MQRQNRLFTDKTAPRICSNKYWQLPKGRLDALTLQVATVEAEKCVADLKLLKRKAALSPQSLILSLQNCVRFLELQKWSCRCTQMYSCRSTTCIVAAANLLPPPPQLQPCTLCSEKNKPRNKKTFAVVNPPLELRQQWPNSVGYTDMAGLK